MLGATDGAWWAGSWMTLNDPNMGQPWFPGTPGPNPGPNFDYPDRSGSFMGVNLENGMEGQFRWRHLNNTTCNFLYVDGHAEGLKYRRFAYGGSELQWRNLLPDQ
jgi:prepilin-type processing-associated H-X9-DG protein